MPIPRPSSTVPLVIADASPLIGLDRAGYLDLLPGVFADLAAPPAVVAEFGRPDWLREVQVERPSEVVLLRALTFGAGESEALAVALEHPGPTVLLDEKRGRRFAAECGIAVIGTAGVVLRAKQRELIPAVLPVLDALRDTGFRLSEALYQGTLKRAGEA
jgi:predicted nucleic acid-binding protein